jgi:DNA repair exonuclease SbcCD nuclease subunit
MKLLYFTDSHVRGTTPENRLDNFIDALRAKFVDIVQIAKQEKINVLTCGGDFFERALLSPSIVREFVMILREARVPIYINLGNHDILGHNPKTVERTMLGLVNTLAPEFKILSEPIVIDNVEFFATPYTHGIDSNLQSHVIPKSTKAKFTFHLIHSMLVKNPFIAGHVLWQAVASNTGADVVFCSHYHPEQSLEKIQNTWFVAPGSVARLSAIPENINRIPKIALVDTSKDRLRIEYRELPSARPGSEIFDKAGLQDSRDYQESLEAFVSTLTLAQFRGENVESIIEEVAQSKHVDQEIVQEALRRVSKARERREFNALKRE